LLLWLMTTAVMALSAAGFVLLVAWLPSRIATSGGVEAGALPAASPARRKSRCEECGWIESMRETEITVRLRDGTSRVIVDAHRGALRLGERVVIIDGAE
jgi:hypothetical protein